jgi:hypothetical protein
MVKRKWGLSPFLLLAFLACNRQHQVELRPTIEEPAPTIASTVHTGDPKSAEQLVSGFYSIEENAWRGTAKNFSVMLHTPAGARQNGATLDVRLTVPPVITQKLGTVTLMAAIGGSALAPQAYPAAGQFIYKRDVPTASLSGDTTRVDFQLDKAMPPGSEDLRELGIIITSVGLASK